jgi:hypothetical protein
MDGNEAVRTLEIPQFGIGILAAVEPINPNGGDSEARASF